MSSRTTLDGLRNRYRRCKEIRGLSEVDTQVLLVEPVLALAGWEPASPDQVRRASRDHRKMEFDVAAFGGERLRLALECKRLGSPEYNVSIEVLTRGDRIGRLRPDVFAKERGDEKWGDGAAQLRSYCCRFTQYESGFTIPILTDGFRWAVFRSERFVEAERRQHPLELADALVVTDMEAPDFPEILRAIEKP